MPTQTVPDVGAGTSLALATTGITLHITDLSMGDVEYEVHDTTYLGTTVAASGNWNSGDKLFGAHAKSSGFDITFHWDWDVMPALGIWQTLTLTDPDGNTMSGTGGLSKVGGPTYTPDGLVVGTAHVELKGNWAYPVGT